MEALTTIHNEVTIAKALAISLMVLGHSGCPEEINHFLGIIRMPLFFIMSGYCFKPEYIQAGSKYIKRRITGIYIPYIKWGIFFLLIHNALCLIGLYNIDKPSAIYSLSDGIHRLSTIITCMSPEEELIGGYWFLHDLFWGSILFYASLRTFKNCYFSIIVLFSLSLFTCYYDWTLSYILYPRTLLASVFITIGHIYKKYGWTFDNSWSYIALSLFTIAAISCFWYSNLLIIKWDDIPLYTILATTGSLMLFGLGRKIINWNPPYLHALLIYVGNKTFNILTWHLLCFKLLSYILIKHYNLPWAEMSKFPVMEEWAEKGWFVMYFAIGLTFPLCWSYAYDRLKAVIRIRGTHIYVPVIFLSALPALFNSCTNDNISSDRKYYCNFHNPKYPIDHDSLKILVLGNSFSESAIHYLDEMVDKSGIDSKVVGLYGVSYKSADFDLWLEKYMTDGHISLNRYAGTLSMEREGTFKRILSQTWDVIIINQASHLSYDWSNFHNLPRYIEALTSCCPSNPCIVYQIPWSHIPEDMPWMLDGNIECSKRMVEQCGIDIFIPTGTAIQLARSTNLNDNKYMTSDNWHLNAGIGEYIASCTWYQALFMPVFNHDIMDIDISPIGDYTESDIILAKMCARAAVSSPFNYTDEIKRAKR